MASSIGMRSATGDLKPWTEITQRELAETYRVSAYVAKNAIAELKAVGILGDYGGRNNVVPRDIIRGYNRTHRTARILDLIALHVADLEADMAALEAE